VIPRQVLAATAVLVVVATGMLVYLWRLRTREVQRPQALVLPQHLAPPTTGPVEKVSVWVAYDGSGTLRAQSISIPVSAGRQQRAEELLRGLVELYTGKDSPHPLQAGAEVREVFMIDPGIAVVDVNAAFADGQISGILAEELTIGSLVQTLAANFPGLMRVKILVDGKERATLAGHIDTSGFYEVGQITELANQLSSP